MVRAPKGTVRVNEDRGSLRLRWTCSGRRYSLALNLRDTVANRQLAAIEADRIMADIASGHFDQSLAAYRPGTSGDGDPSVVKLFTDYTAWKRRQISKRSLNKYLGLIPRLNAYFKQGKALRVSEDQAFNFRDWLLSRVASSTAKERIGMMRACWVWAINKKVLIDNPWGNVRVQSQPRPRPRPFTHDEYSQIIDGFKSICPHYADFVIFTMGVGCRIGESAGLRWGHLSEDCSVIWIGESWGRGERKSTKTNKARSFQLSDHLKIMLCDRKPDQVDADDLVFSSPNGSPIDDHNFRRRYWGPVLENAGIPYRKPYSMRHSFISQAFDQGWSVSEIASITGNTEETILRSYTGGVRGRAAVRSVWPDKKPDTS